MSYIVQKTIRGRENGKVGSKMGRERLSVGGSLPPVIALEVGPGKGTAQTLTSVTYTGTVATATKTAHGFLPGQIVRIAGADQSDYNGDKRINTVPTSATFTYDIFSAQATTATGTVTATERPK